MDDKIDYLILIYCITLLVSLMQKNIFYNNAYNNLDFLQPRYSNDNNWIFAIQIIASIIVVLHGF
jgi:hypothetical protein